MNERQNWQCPTCGVTQLGVPQYSDMARRLLRTNKPPQSLDSHDEAAFIRDELMRGRDMLASVDKDIATLQAMLEGLQEKREALQKFVDDHTVILSPFRRVRLPPEILTEIFHFVEPVVDTNVKRGLWRLGHICSYWRSVLISSPFLWSTICIHWEHVFGNTASLLEEILSRSGNSLLTIRLTVPYYRPTHEQISAAFNIIVAVSHRWHAIALDMQYSHIPPPTQLKDHIPMLTKVSYKGATFPEWLQGAPSLRKLRIITTLRASSAPASYLPCSQLRKCDIGSNLLTLRQEYRLLRQCTTLEIYTIRSRENTDPVPSDLLYMPKLHTLTVCDYDGPACLDFLIVPSLDHVVFGRCVLAKNFVSSFSNLLSRSHCFPTKLKINALPSQDVLSQLCSLAHFQKLTTLDATCCSSDLRHFGPALTLQSETNSVILLPRLEKIHLRSDGTVFALCDMTLVIEMVRSRWHLQGHVKAISRLAFFAFTPTRYSCDLPQFRARLAPLLAFSDEGLEIIINHSS